MPASPQPTAVRNQPRWPFWPNALTLSVAWLILSGHYDPFHIGLGMISVCIVLFLNRNALRSEEQLSYARLRWGRLLRYAPWLLMEMVLSALHVAKVVLGRNSPLAPRLVRFHTEQPNDLARVILGNSITLTPGTLTLDIDEDGFLIHCLTRKSMDSLLEGTMQRKVAGLFVDDPGSPVSEVREYTTRKGHTS